MSSTTEVYSPSLPQLSGNGFVFKMVAFNKNMPSTVIFLIKVKYVEMVFVYFLGQIFSY